VKGKEEKPLDEKEKSALSKKSGMWEALGFLALSLGLILYCLVKQSGIRYEWKLSPWLFPLLVSLFLLALSVALLLRAIRACRGFSGEEEKAQSGLVRPLAALGLTAGYTLALKFVPFAPATAVLLALLLLLFGEKRPWALVLIPLLATALIRLVFGAALHVDLP
jgi:hypothetical protein